MSDTVITVENLGKKYVIGHQREQRYVALRDVIADNAKYWGQRLLRPFGSPNGSSNPTREEIWALKDVSFEVKRGERLGIIGRNGAGKSTLLKILSRITEPTAGRVRLRGRVASLLEVGTGFHPELTGRENIYLNGAILGMSRAEIRRKFDEIVDFAEIEKFLDTPVKRYSSGMYVRLAFAVAAHLEPEILLVDEVLAVGDTAFQKKCLGKMENVSEEGRTILFVSHNMSYVAKLCNTGLLLEGGCIKFEGEITSTISKYLASHDRNSSVVDLTKFESNHGAGEIKVLSLELLNAAGNSFAIPWDEPIRLSLKYKANQALTHVSFAVGCQTVDFTPVFTVRSSDESDSEMSLQDGGIGEITVEVEHNLRAGHYNILLGISSGNYAYYYNPSAAHLEILGVGKGKYLDKNSGIVNCISRWSF
jgi:lipopolysaccharide transport system ATP-binding protein